MLDSLCTDGREQAQEHHIPTQVSMDMESRDSSCFPHSFVVKINVDPNCGKRRKVGTLKSME